MTPIRIGRALLSVSDKSGVVEFAAGLVRHGVKLLSTGGTASALRAAGLPVRDVSELTGYPELFDGRVKTLHPAVHGGVLYRRGHAKDEDDRHRHGVVSIDLVAVNLYPFESTVSRPGIADLEAVEQIDIGGPAMIRAAAKNHQSVVVVVDPDQYAEVLESIDRHGGVTIEIARRYARRAFTRTSSYDAAIAEYLGRGAERGGASGGGAPAGIPGAVRSAGSGETAVTGLPERIESSYELLQRLRYGENPGQEGALYVAKGGGPLATLAQRRGKTLSYNNLLDVEGALALLHEFEEPASVVIKHRSPSGVAAAPTMPEAIAAARDADRLSAFGGVLGLNRALDDAALDAIGDFFFEVVLAPEITADETRIGALRKNLVLLDVPGLLRGAGGEWTARTYLGGLLAETLPGPPRFDGWKAVSRVRATPGEESDLRFAWRVARHVISNAIVIARGRRTLGIGAGQSSRVDAVRLALLKAERAGHDVRGAVLCSDAFFPFADSVEIAARAGIAAIAHPGGSVRDGESIAAADAAGVALVATGERCFLH